MIIFIETRTGNRMHFRINHFSDFQGIFQVFPQTREIVFHAGNIKDAAKDVIDYISSHDINAWSEEGDAINKSIKHHALALGMAMASILSPQSASTTMNPPPAKIDLKTNFGTHPSDHFLWNIQQIETSGGKNLNHPTMKHGKYRGETAIGKFGFLRPTVLEVINRLQMSGELQPEHKYIARLSRDQMAKHFASHPQHELDLARTLATHVISKHDGNTKKAAYSWLMGHNKPTDQITDTHLHDSDYVQKFNRVSRHNPFRTKKFKVAQMSGIAKSEESASDYQNRFTQWKEHRSKAKSESLPKERNFVPDPGRLREKELDNPESPEKDIKNYINHRLSEKE